MAPKNNIIYMDFPDNSDITADKVLEESKGSLDKVLVLGVDDKGEYHFLSNTSDEGTLLILIERFKHIMFD